jgi:hypothetical protein
LRPQSPTHFDYLFIEKKNNQYSVVKEQKVSDPILEKLPPEPPNILL